MWLICFQPLGTREFVPQILCYSEQEAKEFVINASMSVVGSYIYMFVPTASPVGYFKRQEPYSFPSYQPTYPMWIDQSNKPEQSEIGDYLPPPAITC